MKTSTIIAAAIFTLQSGFLFAGNDHVSTPVTNETSMVSTIILAPVTPAEATFEDFVPINAETPSLNTLAPSVPQVADFEDASGTPDIANRLLNPLTPAEAEFE